MLNAAQITALEAVLAEKHTPPLERLAKAGLIFIDALVDDMRKDAGMGAREKREPETAPPEAASDPRPRVAGAVAPPQTPAPQTMRQMRRVQPRTPYNPRPPKR